MFDGQGTSVERRVSTGGLPLWRFVDFVVTIRTPLFMMLQPFIQYKVRIALVSIWFMHYNHITDDEINM